MSNQQNYLMSHLTISNFAGKMFTFVSTALTGFMVLTWVSCLIAMLVTSSTTAGRWFAFVTFAGTMLVTWLGCYETWKLNKNLQNISAIDGFQYIARLDAGGFGWGAWRKSSADELAVARQPQNA